MSEKCTVLFQKLFAAAFVSHKQGETFKLFLRIIIISIAGKKLMENWMVTVNFKDLYVTTTVRMDNKNKTDHFFETDLPF